VLLRQLSNGHVGHLDCVMELFLGKLDLKFIVLITASQAAVLSLFRLLFFALRQAELLGKVGIVEEVIKAEDPSLSVDLRGLFVWDDV